MDVYLELDHNLQTIHSQIDRLAGRRRVINQKLRRHPGLASRFENRLCEVFPKANALAFKNENLRKTLDLTRKAAATLWACFSGDEQTAYKYLDLIHNFIRQEIFQFPSPNSDVFRKYDIIDIIDETSQTDRHQHTLYTLTDKFATYYDQVGLLKAKFDEIYYQLKEEEPIALVMFEKHFLAIFPKRDKLFRQLESTKKRFETLQLKAEQFLLFLQENSEMFTESVRFVEAFEFNLNHAIFQVPEVITANSTDSRLFGRTVLADNNTTTTTTVNNDIPPPLLPCGNDQQHLIITTPSLSINPLSCNFNIAHCLPNEILVNIFNRLHILDRIRLRLVCRRLCRLALARVEELFVGYWEETLYNHLPIHRLNQIYLPKGQHERTEAAFRMLTKQIGSALKRLRFNDLKSGKMINLLIENCPNLICIDLGVQLLLNSLLFRLLSVYGNQLEEFQCANDCINNVRLFLNPHKLRKLMLSYRNLSTDLSSDCSIQSIFDQFPLLDELNIWTYMHNHVTNRLSSLRLSSHVTSFSCGNIHPFTWNQMFPFDQIQSQIRSLGLAPIGWDYPSLRNLQNFDRLVCLKIEFSQSINFELIIPIMTNLKELNLYTDCDPFMHDFVKNIEFISTHLHKLRKLILQHIPISSMMLEAWTEMRSLTHLEIVDYKYFFPKEQESQLVALLPFLFPNLNVLVLSTHYLGPFDVMTSVVFSCLQLREMHLIVPNGQRTNFVNKLMPFCRSKDIILFVHGYDEWEICAHRPRVTINY